MSDPIADMLTHIRNTQTVGKASMVMPSSRLKMTIAKVLKDEGYIDEFAVAEQSSKSTLTISLKYYAGRLVTEHLEHVSKPDLHVYKDRNEIPQVMNGLGVAIVLTPQGLMVDRYARTTGVGDGVIYYIA